MQTFIREVIEQYMSELDEKVREARLEENNLKEHYYRGRKEGVAWTLKTILEEEQYNIVV